MITLRLSLLAAVLVQTCFSANLAVSTYFKDGFTPTAIASDAQGNILVAGSAVIDPVAQTTGVAVAKLNPQASQYVYLAYLDSAASDTVSAITVDSAGNAYVAGWTTNPNFPVVGGGSLGTPPPGGPVYETPNPQARSFVTKLSPDGGVLFSVFIGGGVFSEALGIALTPQGQILVSGLAPNGGFPSTPGAYNFENSTGTWFLMELDPTASTVIFSATGIGGSSIAFDSAGNIYLAGSGGAGFPITPGAYQTTPGNSSNCVDVVPFGELCVQGEWGAQHITKVNPTGSTLIYSTALGSGSTINTGLAVDAAGNAYVTGTLFAESYPFTVPAPGTNSSYLSKLDPTGSSLLFSVPVGGGGVALDSSGAVYVGGIVSSLSGGTFLGIAPVAPPAILSWVPQQCWPDNIVAYSEAYVMKVDPSTGDALDAQWIDGSAPTAVGITLAGGNVWIAGFTPAPDVPFTPGTLSPTNLGTGFTPGAYVAAVDFSTSVAAGTPVIACVVDAANLEHARTTAFAQLLTLFGENLGPSTGVAAPDGADLSIAGVTVTFNGTPAPLLYVSSSQINVAVPVNSLSSPAIMQVTMNGQSSAMRQFTVATSNLNVFANLSPNQSSSQCPSLGITEQLFQAVAINADGSLNSCTNPLTSTTVSFFVEGAGSPSGPEPADLPGLLGWIGGCPAPVVVTPQPPVYQVDVQFSDSLYACLGPNINGIPFADVVFTNNGAAVGPLVVPPPPGVPPPQPPIINFTPGQPIPVTVWVTP